MLLADLGAKVMWLSVFPASLLLYITIVRLVRPPRLPGGERADDQLQYEYDWAGRLLRRFGRLLGAAVFVLLGVGFVLRIT